MTNRITRNHKFQTMQDLYRILDEGFTQKERDTIQADQGDELELVVFEYPASDGSIFTDFKINTVIEDIDTHTED